MASNVADLIAADLGAVDARRAGQSAGGSAGSSGWTVFPRGRDDGLLQPPGVPPLEARSRTASTTTVASVDSASTSDTSARAATATPAVQFQSMVLDDNASEVASLAGGSTTSAQPARDPLPAATDVFAGPPVGRGALLKLARRQVLRTISDWGQGKRGAGPEERIFAHRSARSGDSLGIPYAGV